ncbi:hypothetical protein EMCG_07134 [[Emmonsia] crescens]|uniref:ORC6 first cyclin-like domain-containing protein n=1 Tax=[Emmonsia] crescens TaxID=73230 RepID=A0A0G2J600_9EURO|nr:hypothetical protein EMCG_07134 [Emmonsia crescens UAMH 3008]
MSNKSLEQALANLLPTHAEALPPELVKHASSLLAQSRSYGSSLKPEEEIARPYICAEIACKRLRKSLKLPPLLGRPPCPPRVYKKVYTYLEQALLKSSTTSSRRGDAHTSASNTTTTSAPNTPKKPAGTSTSLRTPSKNSPAMMATANGTPLKRPLPATPSRKAADNNRSKVSRQANGISNQNAMKDAPSWTMPLIRRVCKALSTPTATSTPLSRPSVSTLLPPHIFAGVSSILSYVAEMGGQGDKKQTQFLSPLTLMTTTMTKTHGPEPEDNKIYRDRITTLIVAVYFVVLARRRPAIARSSTALSSSSSTSSACWSAEKLDVDTYVEMTTAALASVGLEGKPYVNDVDVWLSIIMTRKWTEGTEWFDNIPGPTKGDEGVGENLEGELANGYGDGDGDEDDDEDAIIGPKRRRVIRRETRRRSEDGSAKAKRGLQPGLGTMMQDRLNWLSEDMREDYLEWKEGVMGRIRAIENGVAA